MKQSPKFSRMIGHTDNVKDGNMPNPKTTKEVVDELRGNGRNQFVG